MSIYKGGYILADISDKRLTQEPQDLLPQDLKDYISKFIDKDGLFKKEILLKPIKLLTHDDLDFISLVTFNLIADDLTYLIGTYCYDNTNISLFISSNGNIYCTVTELASA